MNSVDWFYAIEMPEHFFAEHPVGSVLGRAKYGDYFYTYQGTTVGGNIKDNKLYYPEIGHHVKLFSDAKVIGKTKLGNYVVVSANTYIKDEEIPDNCIVFGQSPNLIIKQKSQIEMREFFKNTWKDM